jgi:hypothetical protein
MRRKAAHRGSALGLCQRLILADDIGNGSFTFQLFERQLKVFDLK